MSSDTTRLRVHPEVISQEVDEDVILIHSESNQIYQLNLTAGRLWQLLREGVSAAEACSRLAEEFDVDDDVIERDVADTLNFFRRERLVVSPTDG